MAKAAVRHRSSRVAMRGQTAEQNKAAIQIAQADGTSAVTNHSNSLITVHAKTLDAVNEVGTIAKENDATMQLWFVDSDDSPVFEVSFDD